MNPWVKRGVASLAFVSAAAIGGYVAIRSVKARPIPTLEDALKMADLPIIHPGGQGMTRRLVEACGIAPDMDVLQVECGAGESALLVAGSYGAMVTGVDSSEENAEKARGKAAASGLETRLSFLQADPHEIPFKGESFDIVFSEFSASALDKGRAIAEWARVCKSGGCVGVHDVVWLKEPSFEARETAALELGLEPETVTEWIEIFKKSGLSRVTGIDASEALSGYLGSIVSRLGFRGFARTAARLAERYGANAARVVPAIARAELMTLMSALGYAMVIGWKR